MRFALAIALLLCSTAFLLAQGTPGAEYQTFQCKVFNSGCKPPQPVAEPAADEAEETAPPPKKVAKVKRKTKPKPKPKVSAPTTAPATDQ